MLTILSRMSLSLYAALGVFLIAFGALYASVDNLLWFHAAAVPSHALEAVRPLYFALMKLVGGASIGLGLLGLFVTFGPLRSRFPFAAATLSICYAVPVAMAAVVAEILAKATGAPTSWHIMGVLLAINLAAYIGRAASQNQATA